MEVVDLLDARKVLTGKECERNEVPEGLYRLSIHIWIINDKKQVLIQQRSSNRKMFPNMWSNTGGAALKSETSVETVFRELKEELDIVPNINDIELITSYKREKDFVDVYLIKSNIDINKIKLQVEEVQDVRWASITEIEDMIQNKIFIKSSYDYFIKYLKDNEK